MRNTATLLAASLLASGAWASCYTVLNSKGEVLSESPNPPVDMSYPLHLTVPERFGPGATLVFGIADSNCGSQTDRFGAVRLTNAVYPAEGAVQVRPGMRPPRHDRQ